MNETQETYQLVGSVLGHGGASFCAEVAERLLNDEPLTVAGLGARGVAKLDASVELGRRVLAARAARATQSITRAEDVVALMGPRVQGLKEEHFYALLLNTKNHLMRVREVSIGSLNASIVHPRELFREAVRLSAASMVVCHNHPSGDPDPSGADIQLTRRLIKAGDVLGIEVLDHVVLGAESHASLRDLGLM